MQKFKQLKKTDLERLRDWLATYPDFDIIGALQVDYTDATLPVSGIFPAGLVEISRDENIIGSTTITNQYNFALYCVFNKAAGDDVGAAFNADWVMGFQRWVQEQSVRGLVPRFGNTVTKEKIQAQNGVLYEQEESGVAVYMIQLSVTFETFYEAL